MPTQAAMKAVMVQYVERVNAGDAEGVVALYADGATIARETARMLDAFGPQRHIANLGHGVYPDIPVDGVRRFIDTVKEPNHRK